MAWIRWRTTLKGQRLAYIQWRDDLGEVHSKALKTDNEAVAQTYLRAFERSHGARQSNGALKSATDALDMRHKTAAMTMRYAHSTSERRRAAVGRVLG